MLSSSKAKKILKDGSVKGKKLTKKQKRYMGVFAGKNMAGGGKVKKILDNRDDVEFDEDAYKGFKKGGKVRYYQRGGRNTDTVPAWLTPGETVVTKKQGTIMADNMGTTPKKMFRDAGVPGYKHGGKVKKKSDVYKGIYLGKLKQKGKK